MIRKLINRILITLAVLVVPLAAPSVTTQTESPAESFYNELELPHLLRRGVIEDVILDY